MNQETPSEPRRVVFAGSATVLLSHPVVPAQHNSQIQASPALPPSVGPIRRALRASTIAQRTPPPPQTSSRRSRTHRSPRALSALVAAAPVPPSALVPAPTSLHDAIWNANPMPHYPPEDHIVFNTREQNIAATRLEAARYGVTIASDPDTSDEDIPDANTPDDSDADIPADANPSTSDAPSAPLSDTDVHAVTPDAAFAAAPDPPAGLRFPIYAQTSLPLPVGGRQTRDFIHLGTNLIPNTLSGRLVEPLNVLRTLLRALRDDLGECSINAAGELSEKVTRMTFELRRLRRNVFETLEDYYLVKTFRNHTYEPTYLPPHLHHENYTA
jgi:hypothetical protein